MQPFNKSELMQKFHHEQNITILNKDLKSYQYDRFPPDHHVPIWVSMALVQSIPVNQS